MKKVQKMGFSTAKKVTPGSAPAWKVLSCTEVKTRLQAQKQTPAPLTVQYSVQEVKTKTVAKCICLRVWCVHMCLYVSMSVCCMVLLSCNSVSCFVRIFFFIHNLVQSQLGVDMSLQYFQKVEKYESREEINRESNDQTFC